MSPSPSTALPKLGTEAGEERRSRITGARLRARRPRAEPGWSPPPPQLARRRPVVALALIGAVAVLAGVLVVVLGGGSEAPPATAAARLMPADAFVYVHLSTDAGRPAVRRADALLAGLPDHGAGVDALASRLVAIAGGSTATQFSRDIRPWLGREAAFALLDTGGGSAGSLIALSAARPGQALAFVRRAGAVPSGAYGGVALYRYPTGAELAFVHGFLVVGQPASVRISIDAAEGRVASLAASSLYRRATQGEPAGRVLDAYVSAAGRNRVLVPAGGVLGELAGLLGSPDMLAAAVAVAATPPGLAIRVHTVLSRPDTTPAFTPTLPAVLPRATVLMLDGRNLSTLAPRLLALTSRIGLLSAVPDILHRLGQALLAQGYNPRSLLALFRGETAIALAGGHGAPALVIVTRTANATAARLTLANAVAPLTRIFAPDAGGSGVEPALTNLTVDGVAAHQLKLGPGLQVDYAVFRGLIVLSTSLRGIADLAASDGSLSTSSAYRSTLRESPAGATTLGFSEFSQLLSLVEQTTLARGSGFRALLPDLQRIRAVGLESSRGESDTTAELFLQIP